MLALDDMIVRAADADMAYRHERPAGPGRAWRRLIFEYQIAW